VRINFRKNNKFLLALLFWSLCSFKIYSQEIPYQQEEYLENRVIPAPEYVFEMFRQAGMDPKNHRLTDIEKEKVGKAFSILPPLHQRILKKHLHSISFMDNMPNTALTSPVDIPGATEMFNITFRAGILNESISEWATTKENTCFDRSANTEFEVIIHAGDLDAIQYVLLHEATHVIDAVLNFTPHVEESDALVEPTPFTQGIWRKMNVPVEVFTNPLLETTRFRSGKAIAIASAPEVYKALEQTPYVSLYGMASWFEDFAEFVTIYHLTNKMNQPYRISVKKNNKEVACFEPMKSKLVQNRLKQLMRFYKG